MHQLVIFASGAGSNAAAIIDWFEQNGKARVALIVCNKPGAGVLSIAQRKGIPTLLINKQTTGEELVAAIAPHRPALVILAGYLWKIPAAMTQYFPNAIINIHPALLPRYGGKGMYGAHVHQAVVAAGEQESGITIHYVNEEYDEGNIIVQAHCRLSASDTPDTLATKIHQLEHFYFPRTIEFLLAQL
jgi:phosphoribosylglycinamide formyltransferase-1